MLLWEAKNEIVMNWGEIVVRVISLSASWLVMRDAMETLTEHGSIPIPLNVKTVLFLKNHVKTELQKQNTSRELIITFTVWFVIHHFCQLA